MSKNISAREQRLRQAVVEALSESGTARTRELFNRLRRPGSYDRFKSLLTALLKEGTIERAAKRTWRLPRGAGVPAGTIGTLHLNGNGGVLFLPLDGTERLQVRGADLNGALPGDTVRVKPLSARQGLPATGQVVAIDARAARQVVGRIERWGRRQMLIPIDGVLKGAIAIRHSQLPLHEGMQVLAGLVYETTHYQRTVVAADIIRSYGEASRAELLQASLRCALLLPSDFPPPVLREAEQLDATIPAAGAEGWERRDLRDWTIFTIDPPDARDFDDAVSITPLPDGGFRLGVHIADVSHYVAPGSQLDREALQRCTSVYLVGEVVPMLPLRLSSDLCSLREGEDRYALSCLIDYDERGRPRRSEVFPSLIRSCRRFDYNTVEEILSRLPRVRRRDYDPEERHPDTVERSLYHMNLLFRKLRRRRLREGSLDFSTAEPRFELDDTGLPVAVDAVRQLDSHRLVEEFMLAANRDVARRITEAAVPGIYRVHEVPSGEKLLRFTDFVRHLGVVVDPEALQTGEAWQKILREFRGTATELVLNEVVLRSMMKAVYSTENRGHFGLAFDNYTHFTSPIRRYPDLLVHRILKQMYHKRTLPAAELKRAAQIATLREINAMEAERESIRIKQLLYLENRVGERWRGVIRGIERFGIFIELEEILADGMVPVAALDDDYYVYDAKSWTMQGRNQGICYQIGQPVLVEVTRCDVAERKLDLKIVESLRPRRYYDKNRKRGSDTSAPQRRPRKARTAAATGTPARGTKRKRPAASAKPRKGPDRTE